MKEKEDMMICTRCGHSGPEDDFYSMGVRRSARCKECDREAARKRYWKRKAEHPERVRAEGAASSRRYQARIRAEGGPRLEAERNRTRRRVRRIQGRVAEDLDAEWERVIEADPCSYCGGHGGSIDHIVAWIRSLDGSWENLTGACLSCNQQKRVTSMLHFLIRRTSEVT